jgi:hypothetical protein
MYPVQTQGQQSSVAVESQPFTQNAQFQSPMTSGFSNYHVDKGKTVPRKIIIHILLVNPQMEFFDWLLSLEK